MGNWVNEPVTGRTAVTAIIAGLAAYVAIFALPVVAARLGFPGVLDHQEAVTLYIRGLIAEDISRLYATPDPFDAAEIYTPLYYLFVRLWDVVADWSLLQGRAGSWALVALSALAVATVGRRVFRVRGASLLGLGFAVCISLLHGWIDLARVEALLLFAVVAFVVLAAWPGEGWAKLVALVLLAVAAFFVKQTAGALVGVLFLLGFANRRYFAAAGAALLGLGLANLAAAWFFGQAYAEWILHVPGAHRFELGIAPGVHLGVMLQAPILLVGPVALAWLAAGRDETSGRATAALLLGYLVALAMAVLSAGKAGGLAANFALPIVFAGLLGAIPVAACLWGAADRGVSLAALAVLAAICVSIGNVEIGGLRNLWRPTAVDRAAYRALERVMTEADGPTWSMTWGHFDRRLEGGRALPPIQQLCQFHRHCPPAWAGGEDKDWALRFYGELIRRRRFAAIALSPRMMPVELVPLLEAGYTRCPAVEPLTMSRRLRRRTLWPEEIWLRDATWCAEIEARLRVRPPA